MERRLNSPVVRLQGFVAVQNRSRDDYQVPAALAEAGLLTRLVTDFYAPAPLRRLAGYFARRNHPAITWRRTTSVWTSFFGQVAGLVLRLRMERVFRVTDALLAARAARIARTTGAALMCYGSYVPQRAATRERLVIDFEYHPHPRATYAILSEDNARFPETQASFSRERRDWELTALDDPWRRADRIVCASAMTRRCLEAAGCDPAIIDVVPYGLSEPRALRRRDPGTCRFLFVGQGVQRKGLHHLIRAWQARERVGATLTLICYDIDPGIAATICASTIELLRRQSPDELDAHYHRADVMILPSLVEGFGLVYLEALSRGCHVVGTANTGLPDLGLSSEAASIVEPGAIPALGAAIDALIARKASGTLSPEAVQAAARSAWQWSDFRARIGEIAADELASWNARYAASGKT